MLRTTKRDEKDVMDRSWASLTALKNFFENSGREKVKDFDGFALTTKDHVYTLYDGQLSRADR